MRNFDLTPLMRQWIGFEKLASNFQSGQEGFPPYNIQKSDDNHYRITLALAGYKQEELSIEVEGPRMTISGKPAQPQEKVTYLHQGLIYKEFSLTFTLAEHMTVKDAQFINGLLHIDLERQVPEALKPQRIAINTHATTALENKPQNDADAPAASAE